jgi:hypothetical protein
MLDRSPSFELDAKERAQLAADGYVLRTGVFDAAEVAVIAKDCEDLVTQLQEANRSPKQVVGSYMFEMQREVGTVVKWEPSTPDVVMGVEPFAHISKPLNDWGLDARLVDPCKAIVGQDDIILFTEKLNVKRAHHGGPIVLHQDFPYWENMTAVAPRIATAMVFLDDATLENGCLQVAPGTHTRGKWPQRKDADGFGSLEMDQAQFDMDRLVPLVVPAGSVAFFGAFLVHQSMPNLSDGDRRALLYSYQPAGSLHSRDIFRVKDAKPIT